MENREHVVEQCNPAETPSSKRTFLRRSKKKKKLLDERVARMQNAVMAPVGLEEDEIID